MKINMNNLEEQKETRFKRFINYLNTPLKKSTTDLILDTIFLFLALLFFLYAYNVAEQNLTILFGCEIAKTLLICINLIVWSSLGCFILLISIIKTEKKATEKKGV